jgi:pimeloyl-ACP methyl ester carboxylesterase
MGSDLDFLFTHILVADWWTSGVTYFNFWKCVFPADNESTTSDRVNTLENKKASTSVPAILLHGFGASLFSWSRVLKPLADIIGSRVVAFDRPGFGLTSRPQIKGTY